VFQGPLPSGGPPKREYDTKVPAGDDFKAQAAQRQVDIWKTPESSKLDIWHFWKPSVPFGRGFTDTAPG
jgi:hypothetical protein